MAISPKLKVDVNHNPTKKGIKVQFVLPQSIEGDAKATATQKLQAKLNQGLSQYNLTVSQDTDVPYSNVIGFLIPIADVKLLIKNAITGGGSGEPAPEEIPAPEEPVAEIKRMQELAGLLKEYEEESAWFSQEYEEGPGATEEEIEDVINFYSKDRYRWDMLAKEDFERLSQGYDADIKMNNYPAWKKEDFEKVLNRMEEM
jgi:hypothetical protein